MVSNTYIQKYVRDRWMNVGVGVKVMQFLIIHVYNTFSNASFTSKKWFCSISMEKSLCFQGTTERIKWIPIRTLLFACSEKTSICEITTPAYLHILSCWCINKLHKILIAFQKFLSHSMWVYDGIISIRIAIRCKFRLSCSQQAWYTKYKTVLLLLPLLHLPSLYTSLRFNEKISRWLDHLVY